MQSHSNHKWVNSYFFLCVCVYIYIIFIGLDWTAKRNIFFFIQKKKKLFYPFPREQNSYKLHFHFIISFSNIIITLAQICTSRNVHNYPVNIMQEEKPCKQSRWKIVKIVFRESNLWVQPELQLSVRELHSSITPHTQNINKLDPWEES